jgi:hypothetical protein
VPPPAILNGEDIVLIISRPSIRRAEGSLSVSAVVSLVGIAYHPSMKPQIVLDTHVLVAALRSRRGAAFHLVSLLPAAPFEINLSVPLVFEYEEVLPQHRHVMRLTSTDIADFLDFLCANTHRPQGRDAPGIGSQSTVSVHCDI